jgi:predicted phage baseplate assembly protein
VLDADGAPRSTLRVAVDGVEHVEVEDFVDSGAADPHYRLTRDNDGYATIHFGDGTQGRAPARDAVIRVRYRVGIGDAGRVAADALTVFEARAFPDSSQRLLSVRNPFASASPAEPETPAAARLLGPRQLARQERCVTARDFDAVALAGVQVGGVHVTPLLARTTFRHTGSWTTAVVSLDLPGHAPIAATPGLREAFGSALAARKLAGLDVRVEDARYAPLSIALRVEVRPEYFAREVRAAILAELTGDEPTSTGALPFFAHGRFDFGQAVHLSDLYAVVSGVAGVLSLAVTRFKRLGDRHPDREAAGFIEVGELELARCDNDPAHTENGVLVVRTIGGKEG